jgi:amino acid permease
MVMQALGELAVMYPVNGAFVHYIIRFLDPAWYVWKKFGSLFAACRLMTCAGALPWAGIMRSNGSPSCPSRLPLLASQSISGALT